MNIRKAGTRHETIIHDGPPKRQHVELYDRGLGLRWKTKCSEYEDKTVSIVVSEIVYSDRRVSQLLEGVPDTINSVL